MPKDLFRSYDPTTDSIVFWGQTYDLSTIGAEIERIMRNALVEITKMPEE